MILTAHQPVYLPWLGLFHKIALADKYVLLNEVQYLHRDWMNRNKIKTGSGLIWLTVPVLHKEHRGDITSKKKIYNDDNWMKKHLDAIYFNYKKTPFFEDYYPFFEDVYNKEWLFLADLNEYMLKWFLKELNINTEFVKDSDYTFEGDKSDLIVDMCKKLGADTYIFGKLGKDYAIKQDFDNAGIKLIFQDYNHPQYPQRFGEFAPNLSIIDLLFNCGPKSYEILMSNNMIKSDLKKDTENKNNNQ